MWLKGQNRSIKDCSDSEDTVRGVCSHFPLLWFFGLVAEPFVQLRPD